MNLDLDNNEKLSQNKDLKTITNNEIKYRPDSRNRMFPLKKSYHLKISSTVPTENSQTLTIENISSKNKSNKELKFSSKNLLIRRKRKKQKTIFQPKNNDKFILHDILFYSFYKKSLIDFIKIREFIITIQRKVNEEYASNQWEVSNSNDDHTKIKKLESLIARYSIIIYYLVSKNKIEDAKNILLLMIKENIYYIDYHSIKLFKLFNKLQQKYEILNVYPKITKELFNIYSFIIKYCAMFNFTKYKNMFLVRYLALLSLNYKVFKRKIEMRGFSAETRNQIKYWFAIGLHYTSYYTIMAYCPLKVPLKISGLILKLYRNLDENLSTRQEKSILINTSYNQGILYYTNNQSDLALKSLKLTKQKIITFHDNDYNDYNNVNKIIQIMDNSKINSTTTINTKKIRSSQKNSLIPNYFNGLNTKELLFNKKLLNYAFSSSNDFIEQIFLNEGNRKKYLKMEDISEIFFLNLNENNSFFDNDENSFIAKKSISPLPSIRGSQSEFDKFLKMKEFNIPQYLKEPLFFNIELLMSEIEIDRKNYLLAYEHIKNCIILILIIKQLGDSNKNINKFQRELAILSIYLEEIEKNNKNKKLLSQIKSLQNFNLSLSINHEDTKKFKKSSKMINNNQNKEKKEDSTYFNIEKNRISKEIEKFFIFLNTLSVYQIKLLNDTQPINDNGNDLPIFFHNQFKDTLSATQRLNLDNINIMSLSRCAILNDPNNYILPSNLKFELLNKKINNISDKIKTKNTIVNNNIHISFNGSLMNNELNSGIDNNKNNNINDKNIEFDEDNLEFEGTKEFESFKRIIFSGNCTKDLKLYLINNFIFAMSILKRSEKSEIEDMIEYPEIIIGPIKMFKKKNKEKVKYIKENKQEILNQLMKYAEFQYIINSKNFTLENKDKIKKKNSASNSSESISKFIQIQSDDNN